mmetsp:Transcript_29103/g.43867  ORF Transcript_29103/g.43867 Transcript_29103/m.43867 type:complete len:111 (+) Transcript_29103:262-594(+)
MFTQQEKGPSSNNDDKKYVVYFFHLFENIVNHASTIIDNYSARLMKTPKPAEKMAPPSSIHETKKSNSKDDKTARKDNLSIKSVPLAEQMDVKLRIDKSLKQMQDYIKFS